MQHLKCKIGGIVLVVSCKKHQFTRLEHINLKTSDLPPNWIVAKVIADINIPQSTVDIISDELFITIKCHDTYLYLFEKVVSAMELLNNMYDMTHGILRMCDDLLVDVPKLYTFLNDYTKTDYMGDIFLNHYLEATHEMFDNNSPIMTNYYQTHQTELDEMNLTMDDIIKFTCVVRKSPKIITGVVIYFSTKSVQIIVNEFNKDLLYNYILHDKIIYPFVIEDVAYGNILFQIGILPTKYKMYGEYIEQIGVLTNIPYKLFACGQLPSPESPESPAGFILTRHAIIDISQLESNWYVVLLITHDSDKIIMNKTKSIIYIPNSFTYSQQFTIAVQYLLLKYKNTCIFYIERNNIVFYYNRLNRFLYDTTQHKHDIIGDYYLYQFENESCFNRYIVEKYQNNIKHDKLIGDQFVEPNFSNCIFLSNKMCQHIAEMNIDDVPDDLRLLLINKINPNNCFRVNCFIPDDVFCIHTNEDK